MLARPARPATERPKSIASVAEIRAECAEVAVGRLGVHEPLLARVFRKAIESDAEVIVILARRAYVLYRIFVLAGRLPADPRIVSQRAAERAPEILAGTRVAVVDDTVREGNTIKKYLERFAQSSPASLAFYAMSSRYDINETVRDCDLQDVRSTFTVERNECDDDQVNDFAMNAALCILSAPVLYFADFPVLRAAWSPTLEFDLNHLIRALTDSGWGLSSIPTARESRVGNFVLVSPDYEKASRLLLRLNVLRDEQGKVVAVMLMPKRTHAIVKQSSRAKTPAEREVAFRNAMFESSLEGLREFTEEWGEYVAPLGFEPCLRDVHDHWAAGERTGRAELIRQAIANTGRRRIQDVPATLETRATLEVTEDVLLRMFAVVEDSDKADVAERGIEEADLFSRFATLDPQLRVAALSFLHDGSACVPRVTIRDGRVVRVWTLGEAGNKKHVSALSRESLPTLGKVHRAAVPDGWLQLRDKNSVASAEAHAAVAVKQGKRWYFDPGQFSDEKSRVLHEGLEEALMALPTKVRRNPTRLSSWFRVKRSAFGGANAYEALARGERVRVRRLAQIQPR